MPASSAASSALSTASLTHVRSALRGLSNPSRWRFLVKNSETEISRCRVPISAVEMGTRQREISVSEFFTKNRHLLGLDTPRQALLTSAKDAVDNARDSADQAVSVPAALGKA